MAITLGPIIGHTTQNSVKVWIRGEAGANHAAGEFCYGAIDLYQNNALVKSAYCYLKDYFDFTGIVRFEELASDTPYKLRCDTVYRTDDRAPPVGIVVAGPVAGAKAVAGEFRTARPVDAGTLRFVFGSCRYLYWDNFAHSDVVRGDKTFRSILALHDVEALDMTLMIGDQVYADPLNFMRQYQSADELFAVYRKSFEQPHIRRLMATLPTYMVLDDHEIRNDWSKDQMREGNQGFYALAMRAYTSYQHLHNPDTPEGQYWYTFTRGAFPFFVMDARTRRIVNPSSIEPKSMLGREQLNAFLDWLHANRKAPIKFVVSSVPLFPDPKEGEDKWAGFPEERSLILEYLRVERIRGVVVLSGDVHNTSFSRMYCHQDPTFSLTSLVSSPFYWPYPHEAGSDFHRGHTLQFMQWADEGRRVRDRIEYRYEGEGFIGDESFVRVTVDLSAGPRPGKAEIFGRKGKPFVEYPGVFAF